MAQKASFPICNSCRLAPDCFGIHRRRTLRLLGTRTHAHAIARTMVRRAGHHFKVAVCTTVFRCAPTADCRPPRSWCCDFQSRRSHASPLALHTGQFLKPRLEMALGQPRTCRLPTVLSRVRLADRSCIRQWKHHGRNIFGQLFLQPMPEDLARCHLYKPKPGTTRCVVASGAQRSSGTVQSFQNPLNRSGLSSV